MNILVGLVAIVIGLINVISPETGWYLSHGWRFKDAEPSDASLTLGRIGGVVAIIFGVICFFVQA